MVRDLFKCWGGEAGSRQRGYPQDHELTRLALLAGEPHVLAATAADALRLLEREFAYQEAAAWAVQAIAVLDAGGVSATLEAVNGNCWRDKPHDRAGSSKFMGHSRTAVATGVTVRVNVCHLAQELLICAGALTRFPLAELVISGSGHPESFAEFGNRKVLPLRIDQRIPLCGSSESMLTAFFTRYEPWVDARLPLEGASALSLHDGHGPLHGTGRRDG